MNMNDQIQLTLKEERTGETKIREVDGGWFLDYDNTFITDEDMQRQIILEWIEERGEAQHNSKLELISWKMVS